MDDVSFDYTGEDREGRLQEQAELVPAVVARVNWNLF